MSRELDDIDWRLLRLLSSNGRTSIRALAGEVGLSEPSVHERVRRLERDGVITGYRAEIDPEATGSETLAFVSLRLAPGPPDHSQLEAAFRAEASVLEAHITAGEDCYLLKLRVGTPADLAPVLDRIRTIPGVSYTRTTIVLRTALERSLLQAETDIQPDKAAG
jgi:Lrp/AsnC family transcriptional regulator, leucine-responsive regulatory protein